MEDEEDEDEDDDLFWLEWLECLWGELLDPLFADELSALLWPLWDDDDDCDLDLLLVSSCELGPFSWFDDDVDVSDLSFMKLN